MRTILFVLLLIQGAASSRAGTGVVTGRILSLDGTPAAGVRVAAVPVLESNVPASAAVLSSLSQTDSAGNYRLENIPAGRYYITAGLVDRPVYFPGVDALSGASIVSVTATTPVAGVDFKLPRPVSLTVSGRVLGTISQGSFARPVVTLLPQGPTRTSPFPSAQLGNDLSFRISNVPPGRYSIQVNGLATLIMTAPLLITVADKDMVVDDIVMADTAVTSKREGLVQAWSLAGIWAAITTNDKAGTLFASGFSGLGEIDVTGKVVKEIPFPRSTNLRLVRLPGTPDPAFLTYGFTTVVQALDATGKLLWSYPPEPTTPGAVINDAWPVDLDGDQFDEIVLGFNGGTGVHVLDSQGKLLWKSTGAGNIWYAAAGDVRGNGKPQAVTTSATGKVHIWADNGTAKVDLDPGVYSNMVRVGKLSDQDAAATVFAGGGVTNEPIAVVTALAADGTKKWSLRIPTQGASSIRSASLASGKPWLALGMNTGAIHVIDAERGVVIATVDGQGLTPQVAWLRGKDSSEPLLVVSAGRSLTAFRIAP